MKWRSRETLLLLGVTVVVIVVAVLPSGEEGESAAAPKVSPQTPASFPQQTSRQQSGQERVELERLSQQHKKVAGGKAITNAFNSTSWYVAPPRKPSPPPPPPPPPSAPPLPFTYFGRYEDAQKLVVILANGSRLYTVSKGEVIDGTYRVDRITDGSVDLVYLPLNINQSLSIVRAPEKK